MKIKSLNSIKEGEILAESIVSDENKVVLPAGTPIKEEYIPMIRSFGVDIVTVEDPYEEFEKQNQVLKPEAFRKYAGQVQSIMENHVYHVGKSLRGFETIANEIVKEVNRFSSNSVIDVHGRMADLYKHTVVVTLLSVMVAKKMELDEERQYNIAVGCLLHDIGIRYITVPYENRDMMKEAPAAVFEYKKHTIMGYSALEEESWIPATSRKIVLFHHERNDGSGFPLRQRNKEIECKIVQVCDAFDCMISGMECKRIAVNEAFTNIEHGAGKKFDRSVVEAFISSIAKYPVGTEMKNNEGDDGVVVSQTNDRDNPVIMKIKR
jgi:HD-GYP domain-containing protein (c-di-GMP phosphodiesterase class II)